VPGALLKAYLHQLRCRFNGQSFSLLAGIADTDEVTAVLGRVEGLDRLIATFVKGREVQLRQ